MRSPSWLRQSSVSKAAWMCWSMTSSAVPGTCGLTSRCWEHDWQGGLRMLQMGVHTHLITARAAIPLMRAAAVAWSPARDPRSPRCHPR